MDTILLIPYSLESHIMPTLGMANALKNKYRIVYALPWKFKWFAELYGFGFIKLEGVPFGYGFESLVKTAAGEMPKYKDRLKDRMRSRLANHREKKLNEVVEAVAPAFIFLDMMSSTDFVLLYNYITAHRAGIAIHNPMLSTYSRAGIPRIGSSLEPGQRFKTWVENRKVILLNKVFDIREWIIYLGNNNKSMIRKEARKRKIPSKYKRSQDNHFANFFDQVPEIITAPEELEFVTGKAKDNQYYVGPLLDLQRVEKDFGDESVEIIKKIQEWKRDGNVRIVYCSFGSMHYQWNEVIKQFLGELFHIDVKGYQLKIICAFDERQHLIGKEGLRENVFVFERLPQLEMLRHADLFITHAGLGSMKESILSGVPMLAYPFTRDWDSNGNATKVQYHGLGLRGDIQKDGREKISMKVKEVLSNPVYKDKVMQLKKLIEAKYTEERFSGIFEKLVRGHF